MTDTLPLPREVALVASTVPAATVVPPRYPLAVLSVSEHKRGHHLYARAEELTETLLGKMGIGNIVTMTPMAHSRM